MLRFTVRAIALACLAAALMIGVVDGTRGLGSERLELTPLGTLALWAFPRSFPLIEPALTRLGWSWLWDPLLLNLLLLPAVVVFFVLAGMLLVLARNRTQRSSTRLT
jgi:hypothetical protein